MLKFIFGHSGSGKTRYIAEKIRQNCLAGKRTYLIVPEQQAYITERSILPTLPKDSGFYFTIAGFSRLAKEVFEHIGGVEGAKITPSVRTLLMWKAMKSLYGTMREYTAMPDKKTASMMLSACDELRDSGVSAEKLDEVAKALGDTSLARRLGDISAAYAVFNQSALSIFGGDSGDIVSGLASGLAENPYFKNSDIFIDSFTSFTKPELDVISGLMKQADCVYISLAISSPSDDGMQYRSVNDTYNSLRLIADRTATPVEFDKKLTDNLRTPSPELKYLGDNIWNFLAKPFEGKPTGNVSLLTAPTVYAEAEAAAVKILQLKKSGLEFGEIAVIVRNTELIRGVIDSTLERFGIPFFMSERTDLSSKPISRLVASALNAVSRGWQQADVLTLLKTGLCGIPKRDCDLFEDYCAKWNINGNKFTKVWSMNPDGYTTVLTERGKEILAVANSVRERIIAPLQALSVSMKTSANVRGLCQALFTYLETLNIRNSLTEIAEKELSEGNVREAGETLRLYDFLTECFITLCNVFGDSQITADEFSTALSILLSETDIGSVPSLHDCVIIGSAATLRIESVKATIVMGLTEGAFPAAVSSSGILGEDDVKILSENGVKLNRSEEKTTSDELFYFYRAITKPSEKLILTMPITRIGGRTNLPSVAFRRASVLLPNIKIEEYQPIAAYRAPAGGSRYSKQIEQAVTPEVMKSILGDTLVLSNSRLTSFLDCPYKFYAEYMLNLRDGDEAKISYSDSGDFIHFIMEKFIGAYGMSEELPELTHEAVEQISRELTAQYVNKLIPEGSERISHQFERLRRLALPLMESSYDEIKAGKFRPAGLEKNINPYAGSLSPIHYPVYDGNQLPEVIVTGTIDRLDLYRDGNIYYARIIDYKTSDKYDISMDKFLTVDAPSDADTDSESDKEKPKNQPQMLIYLFTVCENALNFSPVPSSVKPAGAAYYYVDEGAGAPKHKGIFTDDETVQAAFSPELDTNMLIGTSNKSKPRIFDEEKYAAVKDAVELTVKRTAAEIYGGQASRRGSEDACKFCKLINTCPAAVKKKN